MQHMDYFKKLILEQRNYVELNRGERLEACSFQNMAYLHQKKMIVNQIKRDMAKTKAQALDEMKAAFKKKDLTRWEDYRDDKIELIAIFIRVLKRKNKVRRWLITHKMVQIYMKVRENLYIRRELDRILFTSIHTALRWKRSYIFHYVKFFGKDIE